MFVFPFDGYDGAKNGCYEKLKTYVLLKNAGLPVLNSVVITSDDLNIWNDENKIKKILQSSTGMIRYLYTVPTHNVENGGEIISIDRDIIKSKFKANADLWILEACKREENLFCFNSFIDKTQQNLKIEVLGRGFDVSDLNKGRISPHEIITMDYPVEMGYYNEWWKYAKFEFCTSSEYSDSVCIRKNILQKYGVEMDFDEYFVPLHISYVEQILHWILVIEKANVLKKTDVFNMSCSVLKSGRFVFWDIQTIGGKLYAYNNTEYVE